MDAENKPPIAAMAKAAPASGGSGTAISSSNAAISPHRGGQRQQRREDAAGNAHRIAQHDADEAQQAQQQQDLDRQVAGDEAGNQQLPAAHGLRQHDRQGADGRPDHERRHERHLAKRGRHPVEQEEQRAVEHESQPTQEYPQHQEGR
jgi:hypothetical protein